MSYQGASGNMPQVRIYGTSVDGRVQVWRDGAWEDASVTLMGPEPEPEQAYGEYDELFFNDLYS